MAISDELTLTQGGVSPLSSTYSTLAGVYYAYLGTVPEVNHQDHDIADYVAANHPAVDADIQHHFQTALAALQQAEEDPTAVAVAASAATYSTIDYELHPK